MTADGKQLVNRARQEAANYRSHYKKPIPGKVLNDRMGNYVHSHTMYWSVRPFGASIMFATHDKHKGLELYSVEPSGLAYVCQFFFVFCFFFVLAILFDHSLQEDGRLIHSCGLYCLNFYRCSIGLRSLCSRKSKGASKNRD